MGQFISKSKKEHRATMSTYFKYMTNTMKEFNRQFCKVTKNKSVFPTDDSFLKMLYPAAMDIKVQVIDRVRARFMMYFDDRLDKPNNC